jgi:hypothetical protein
VRSEEKIVRKVVGAILGKRYLPRLNSFKVVSSTGIVGFGSLLAIGAKTQPNFKNWRYFRKNQYSEASLQSMVNGDIISFQH